MTTWNERWTENPHNDANNNREERIDKIITSIPKDVKKILDLGSGPGVIASRIPKNIEVTAIDDSETALSIIKQKYPNISTLKYSLGDKNILPYDDNSFDLIICSEVLEHLPNSVFKQTIKEINRVASSYVIISNPANDDTRSNVIRCNICGARYHTVEHVRFFTEAVYHKMISDFKVKKVFKTGKRYQDSAILVELALSFSKWTGNLSFNMQCRMCEGEIEKMHWSKSFGSIFFKFLNFLYRKFNEFFKINKPSNYVVLYQGLDLD
jgi:ubiquinone/menaquinone biosynthesis C-methylase UbiE